MKSDLRQSPAGYFNTALRGIRREHPSKQCIAQSISATPWMKLNKLADGLF
jgi:hypothetical protein